MQAHRGAIRVYTQLRRGTTIKVLFPVSAMPGERTSEARWAWEEWRASGTILVADDDDGVRAVVESIVAECGLTMITACDGREAGNLFRDHA
ncbi:MAG: hypothetical protein O2819_09650, partial [Planctomycetota bacterium]|nr:hypothetical protein [Planctomycetota bacterium]